MSAFFWIAITEEQAEQVLCRCLPCMNCPTSSVMAGKIDLMAVEIIIYQLRPINQHVMARWESSFSRVHSVAFLS